jgi:hypothetical protein
VQPFYRLHGERVTVRFSTSKKKSARATYKDPACDADRALNDRSTQRGDWSRGENLKVGAARSSRPVSF